MVVHTNAADVSNDFLPDVLFLIPFNPSSPRTLPLLLFFFEFPAQRSSSSLLYYIPPCRKVSRRGRLSHEYTGEYTEELYLNDDRV